MGLGLVPVYHVARVQSQLTLRNRCFLPLLGKLFGWQIMSMTSKLKDGFLWLILFDKECPVNLLTDTMLDGDWLKRIRAWLLMSDLHPLRAEYIDFFDIT